MAINVNTGKWKLFCCAKSQEPQHQNKRSVRKRKARKHMLEKYFMAEAVEKVELCSSCFWKQGFEEAPIEELNDWSKEAQEIKKLQKRSFTKESIKKPSADMHIWKDCSGTLAQGSFCAKSRRVHSNSLLGEKMCMGANGQIRTSKKKKWKGMSVLLGMIKKKMKSPR